MRSIRALNCAAVAAGQNVPVSVARYCCLCVAPVGLLRRFEKKKKTGQRSEPSRHGKLLGQWNGLESFAFFSFFLVE